ncbi:hypothetical protein AX769_16620 [Frondihabitans sp. PAMC 28766]|uniref:hypothetical protein n=1 Tax=Frondihabitans sp. PAMC 28766 TaxID=1795630 RepID=UPI00078CE675|nr:hypothetical protein [Frondihabitans sp. PAMC 28766]AMM21459.1 hypothetical protein AX769_16620 [Frondihabitans sp. PAMC 28766]
MSAYFDADRLQWLLGIEDTCVYPPEGSAMGQLDEHRLTGHDDHWREDFDRVVALGATGVRYGVSWPLTHTGPDMFDWSVLDERFDYAVNTLGLTIVADLVHYGTPTWLTRSFDDEGYPEAIALFAGRFAERYRGVVDHITPLNEPITTASFCGLRGVWPPALSGWSGWTRVTLQIVDGLRRSIAAIRKANSDATIVHVEASAIYETEDPALVPDVAHHEAIARLPTELLLGRVDEQHPLWPWLVDQGAPPLRLLEFTEGVPEIDVLGVNYYPDLTPRILRPLDGGIAQVTANRGVDGLRAVLEDAGRRYGLPMVVTETSIEGTALVRQEWLESSMALVQEMKASGCDIRGYTWWPLFDFVDWSYASGGQNVEEFVLDASAGLQASEERFAEKSDDLTPFFRRMGLVSIADRQLTRVETSAAASFALGARVSSSAG